ncbi:hypothetical protein ACFSTJ_08770 [Ottowia pentelensis]|uniref:hypothetical protein n=1 Tax=Ottowia pentelensis TaxID=511108 RepID=UPI003626C13A
MAEDEVAERPWVRRVDAPLEGGALSLAALERVQTALYGAVGRDDAWPEALRVLAHEFDAHIALLVAAGQASATRVSMPPGTRRKRPRGPFRTTGGNTTPGWRRASRRGCFGTASSGAAATSSRRRRCAPAATTVNT